MSHLDFVCFVGVFISMKVYIWKCTVGQCLFFKLLICLHVIIELLGTKNQVVHELLAYGSSNMALKAIREHDFPWEKSIYGNACWGQSLLFQLLIWIILHVIIELVGTKNQVVHELLAYGLSNMAPKAIREHDFPEAKLMGKSWGCVVVGYVAWTLLSWSLIKHVSDTRVEHTFRMYFLEFSTCPRVMFISCGCVPAT